MAPETFQIDEFCSGAWSDRPEYREGQIGWDHVMAIHSEGRSAVEFGRCGDTDCWFALHVDAPKFEFYVYGATRWSVSHVNYAPPVQVEPILWVCGTTFDGVREMSGGQNFMVQLEEFANMLMWLRSDIARRWPDAG